MQSFLSTLAARIRKSIKPQRHFPYDFIFGVLRSGNSESVLKGVPADMAPIERWTLLDMVLSDTFNLVVHFLHVPKTGGTTLTAALSSDKRLIVVSVDEPIGSFFAQLKAILDDKGQRLVLVRAHHGLSLIKESGVFTRVEFSFCTIRNPADIHASNANMIIRRIQKCLF